MNDVSDIMMSVLMYGKGEVDERFEVIRFESRSHS